MKTYRLISGTVKTLLLPSQRYIEINESTREEFLRDTDLRSETKAKRVASDLIAIQGKTLIYKSKSVDSSRFWTQLVLAPIQPKMTKFGVNKNLSQGNLMVNCDCPAFKWWGYAYITTSMRAIYPGKEVTIYPKIRNPRLVGTVCKHLISVFQRMRIDGDLIYYTLNKDLFPDRGVKYSRG